jgi:hypothetical protein
MGEEAEGRLNATGAFYLTAKPTYFVDVFELIRHELSIVSPVFNFSPCSDQYLPLLRFCMEKQPKIYYT